MSSMLIISPDKSTLKVLCLAFELKGYKTVGVEKTKDVKKDAGKFNTVLVDMVDSSNWKEARDAACLAAEYESVCSVLLLPRGFDGRRPTGIDEAFSLIVEKPFELIQLVDSVHAENQKSSVSTTK
jgi:hypothetical protein